MPTKSVQLKNQKIPKLRFPGFSDGWEKNRLESICDYKNGGSFENNLVENGKYNLITLNSVDITGNLKDVHKTVGSADWYLQKNDIVMVLSDVAHGNFLGLVDIIPENDKYVLNQRMGLLRKKDDSVDLKFLRAYINKSQYYFKLHGQGSSQQNLSKGDILKFIILLPKLPEQEKLVEFLESTDKWIKNLKAQKESFESYKKGMVQKLFSQEIRFKDENGKNFPKWGDKKLFEFTDIVVGGTPSTNNKAYWNGGVGWLSSGDLKNGLVYKPSKYITELGLKKSAAKLMPVNTVLLAMTGATLGKVGILTFECSGNQSVAGIIPNNNYNSRYLFYTLFVIQDSIFTASAGAAQAGINKSSIENLKIPFPSIVEQQKISEFLTSIDKVIESKQQQITRAEEWKKGLMQGLFV